MCRVGPVLAFAETCFVRRMTIGSSGYAVRFGRASYAFSLQVCSSKSSLRPSVLNRPYTARFCRARCELRPLLVDGGISTKS